MQNTQSLEKRIDACISADHQDQFHFNNKQKKLEEDILSLKVESFDDLEIKTQIIKRIVENKAEFSPFRFSNEKILKNLIQDVITAYAIEKCKTEGSFDPEAPVNYFNLFYPD